MNRTQSAHAQTLFACMVCLILSASMADQAAAYDLTGRKWFQPSLGAPMHADLQLQQLLRRRVARRRREPGPRNAASRAVEEALTVWASVAPLHFVEVEDAWDGEPIETASTLPANLERSASGTTRSMVLAIRKPTPISRRGRRLPLQPLRRCSF